MSVTLSKNLKYGGRPRLVQPIRNQIEMTLVSLDQLIPEDHKVRLVWQYIEKLDFTEFLKPINSVEGSRGRPAMNPKVLLALWLYATIEKLNKERLTNPDSSKEKQQKLQRAKERENKVNQALEEFEKIIEEKKSPKETEKILI